MDTKTTTDSGGVRLLSSDEVAERLGCGRTFVYQMLAEKQIPSVKLGRLRRVRESDLIAFIAAMPSD